MNYRAFFENLQSRYHLEELLLYIHLHPEDFKVVFDLAFQTEEKFAWRVLWAVEKVSQRNPEWFDDLMVQQINNMVMTTKHQGMHRIGLSILTNFPVPDPLNVEMLNLLYDWMLSPKFSIGVQSLAMKLLYKYVKTNDDLLCEFMLVLEQADESEYTAAFVSSKRNILKMLVKQFR